MGYKFKPNKGIKKRVKVSKTGKIKHRHEMNSHLRSGRAPALKRSPSAAPECSPRGKRSECAICSASVAPAPAQIAHERALAAKADTTA